MQKWVKKEGKMFAYVAENEYLCNGNQGKNGKEPKDTGNKS